jgi:molybdopterin converting factor subunit 1
LERLFGASVWQLRMQVQVLFFGMLKDVLGKSADTLEIIDGAKVRDLLEACAQQMPELKRSLAALAVAVNQEYASRETVLESGDEIALLPPVSGGSEGKRRAGCALIVRNTINTEAILRDLKCGEDGAAVVFEGVVRNQTRGRKTQYLDYEAYEEMALKEMKSLARQALERFQIRDVALVHRLGRIEIGGTSVLIVVASPHRAAGFDACRWLIDTLKRTVPIWKKEYFEDGAVWGDGEPFPAEIAGSKSSPPGSPEADDASK